MKKFTLITLLLLAALAQQSYAKDGYKIHLKFTDVKDTILYLAHYYAKPLPNQIYKADSGKVNSKGELFLKSDSAIVGGIYILLLSDHKTYFEFLLDNGDDITITLSVTKADDMNFKNSKSNDDFMAYEKFLKVFGARQQSIQSELSVAHTAADTEAVRKKLKESGKDLITYRRNYITKNPNTLLASIFKELEIPEVPEGKHYNADGKEDSAFAYHYYKDHYWDGFNFQDDRLIHTPILDTKLEEYFKSLVYPVPDSVQKEADMLLAKAKGTKEIFKYILWFTEHYAQDSKVMGMDAAAVYLIENYYMKGYATWLKQDDLQKYIDWARKTAPNVIGNMGMDISMPDINGVEKSVYDIKSKYTMLVFWSPDCGHCQREIPELDSVYNAVLKKKGVKVYAVRADGEESKWKEFIKKNKLEDWINVQDTDHTHQDFRKNYNIYMTPVIYILDEKKIIQGKQLDHTNVADVIEMLERREKMSKKQ